MVCPDDDLYSFVILSSHPARSFFCLIFFKKILYFFLKSCNFTGYTLLECKKANMDSAGIRCLTVTRGLTAFWWSGLCFILKPDNFALIGDLYMNDISGWLFKAFYYGMFGRKYRIGEYRRALL